MSANPAAPGTPKISDYLRVRFVLVPDPMRTPDDIAKRKLRWKLLIQPLLIRKPTDEVMGDVVARIETLFGANQQLDWPSRVNCWAAKGAKLFVYDALPTGPAPARVIDAEFDGPIADSHVWTDFVNPATDRLLEPADFPPPTSSPAPTRSYPGRSVANAARSIALRSQLRHLVGYDAPAAIHPRLTGDDDEQAKRRQWPQNERAGLRWGPNDPAMQCRHRDAYGAVHLLPSIDENARKLSVRNLHRLARKPGDAVDATVRNTIIGAAGKHRTPSQAPLYATPALDHFLDLAQFHGRARPPLGVTARMAVSQACPPDPDNPTPPPRDIFSKLSMVQNYPEVLPYLGLCLSLTCDGSSLTGLTNGAIGFDASGLMDLADIATPVATQIAIDADQVPRLGDGPDAGAIKGGLLVLTDDSTPGAPVDGYHLETIDYDGAGLKLLQYAQSSFAGRGLQLIVALGEGGQFGKVVFASNEDLLAHFSDPKPDKQSRSNAISARLAGLPAIIQSNLAAAMGGGSPPTHGAAAGGRSRTLPILHNFDLAKIGAVQAISPTGPRLKQVSAWVFPAGDVGKGAPSHYLSLHFNANDTPSPDQFDYPPSSRSAGISLVCNDRGTELDAAKARSDTLLADEMLIIPVQHLPTDLNFNPIQLWASDLFLGLVPFVQNPKTGQWHPLTERQASYTIGPRQVAKDHIELASLRLAVAQTFDSVDGAPPVDHHAPPRLFRWNQAGLGVAASDEERKDVDQICVPQRGPAEYIIKADFTSMPSPPLRFAKIGADGAPVAYTFSVAVMDRAGVVAARPDLAISTPPAAASGAVGPNANACAYLRYQPIPAPAVLIERGFGPTENRQKSPTTLVVEDGADDRRWLAPPRADPILCREHGMFDVDHFEGIGSYDAVELNPKTGHFYTTPVHPDPACPTPDTAKTSPIYRRGYNGANHDRPYYPDPMARQLVYRIEEVHAGGPPVELSPVTLPYYRDGFHWPQAEALWIAACAPSLGQDKIIVAQEHGGVRVHLPPARHARVYLSSVPNPATAPDRRFVPRVMALVNEAYVFDAANSVQHGGSPNPLANVGALVEAGALAGDNPMVCPPLVLDLVHPVQRPLAPPKIISSALLQSEDAGVTTANDAVLDISVVVDIHSTGKVDFVAEWTDINDDPSATDGPIGLTQNLIIEQQSDLAEFQPKVVECTGALGQHHSFPDSRHRLVQYRARAHSAFRDYYGSDVPPDNFLSLSAVAGPDLPAGEERSELGLLRFFNARLPATPSVAYAVPTFRWSRAASRRKQSFASIRKSRSFVLWINRGWGSSGPGEQLAVVCLRSPEMQSSSMDQSLKRYVTRWGSDPGRPSGSMPSFGPKASDLANADTTKPISSFLGDQLDTKTSRPAEVTLDAELALFTPTYHTGRQLWYCNIELKDAAASYPFIKLVLARYQEHSIEGFCLSPVVPADFVQLFPDRSVTVSRIDARRLLIRIHGSKSFDGDILKNPKQFDVCIYRQCDTGSDQVGWIPDPEIGNISPLAALDAQVLKMRVADRITDALDDYIEIAAYKVAFPAHWIGKRMISVIENDPAYQRVVYSDVLELSLGWL